MVPLSKNPDAVREGALVSSGLGGEGTRAMWDAPELLGNQAPRQRVDFLGGLHVDSVTSPPWLKQPVRGAAATLTLSERWAMLPGTGVPQGPL